MRLRKQAEGNEMGVQMAPLIDCVFLLLIFFLCTSTLKKKHREVPIFVPHASVATQVKAQIEPLRMQIFGDGTILVEDRVMTLQSLGEYVQTIALQTPNRRVSIESERPTAFQHIMFVINVLKSHGLGSVSLTAMEVNPQQPGKPRGKR